MRLSLEGPITEAKDLVLVYTVSGTFSKEEWIDKGYTFYDVVAIGAGGGNGGNCIGVDPDDEDIDVRNYGGAGGAGGFHRVTGILSALADTVDVVVGAPGANGTDATDNESPDATPGTDGTASLFHDFVGAEGGKGGAACQTFRNPDEDNVLQSDGGDGGFQGSGSGEGAKGGVCGFDAPEGRTPSTKGDDGILVTGPYEFSPGVFTAGGLVGSGGGGGAGGCSRKIAGVWAARFPFASAGGKGAYNDDEAVFVSGGPPTIDSETGLAVVPGKAGGARITPLNGSVAMYGSTGQPGIVAIRLTKED